MESQDFDGPLNIDIFLSFGALVCLCFMPLTGLKLQINRLNTFCCNLIVCAMYFDVSASLWSISDKRLHDPLQW